MGCLPYYWRMFDDYHYTICLGYCHIMFIKYLWKLFVLCSIFMALNYYSLDWLSSTARAATRDQWHVGSENHKTPIIKMCGRSTEISAPGHRVWQTPISKAQWTLSLYSVGHPRSLRALAGSHNEITHSISGVSYKKWVLKKQQKPEPTVLQNIPNETTTKNVNRSITVNTTTNLKI